MLTYWVDWFIERIRSGPAEGIDRTLVLYAGLLAGAAVFFGFMALRHFIGVHSQAADRLEVLVALDRAEEEELRARRRRGAADRLVLRLSIARSIADDLDRAGLAVTVPEFMLLAFVAGAVGFGIGLLRGSAVLGLLLAPAAVMLMRMWVHRRARVRRLAFARQLNDIINLMVGAMRAGYGVTQALTVVVREMPAPASDEVGRVIRQVQLGLPLAAALDNSAERLQNDDWSLVVASIKIQAEVGGNLADILDTVAHTIRERIRILGQIRVLTTNQRLTGWLLSVLPVVMAVGLYLINPEYMSGLFTPGLPFTLAVLGALGIVAGALVIRRIVAIEV